MNGSNNGAAATGSVASGFLFGEKPSIADFSVYHPLWFLRNNPVNAPMIEAYTHVMRWLDRMQAFGPGRVIESDGEAALAEAKTAEPRALEPVAIGVDAKPDIGTRGFDERMQCVDRPVYDLDGEWGLRSEFGN